MDKQRRKRNILLFGLYCALMFWLLFDRPDFAGDAPYWDQVQQNLNLVPLRTIRLYIRLLTEVPDPKFIPHAVINLFGNIIMFIPLGLLLPQVFPKLHRLWKVLLTTALVICAVELIQLLTLVGSLDIDDLILNVLGSAMGYGLYRLTVKT